MSESVYCATCGKTIEPADEGWQHTDGYWFCPPSFGEAVARPEYREPTPLNTEREA